MAKHKHLPHSPFTITPNAVVSDVVLLIAAEVCVPPLGVTSHNKHTQNTVCVCVCVCEPAAR